MGSFANSLFTILLGWLQSVVSAVWLALTSEKDNTFLVWIGNHWILIAGILCITGMVVDLCVYFARWKPYRVWKSFVSGSRPMKNRKEIDEWKPDSNPVFTGRVSGKYEREETVEKTANTVKTTAEQPDLSQWIPDEISEERRKDSSAPSAGSVTVTNAGYVVPADSPYRRPAGRISYPDKRVPENETNDSGKNQEAALISSRRRRKISIGELFSNPEEELKSFDAPQHIIDSRKAYHNPVYPRGWKKEEEDGK